ncbi:uncharacterized protein LOC143040906 [Oratosquilla oratoria]|uniref:uncharacterized protein LOC143040906 n=1 Tax=Oratosquilla oratoria TaxID=337810 RepID=UPI003F75982D
MMTKNPLLTPTAKQALLAALLAATVGGAACMTVTLKEADQLPEELRPIVPGGSWFTDMAMSKLHKKHENLRQQGRMDSHEHSDDSEEVFMLAKLRGIDMTSDGLPVGEPVHVDSHEDLVHSSRAFSSAHHLSREDDDDDDDDDTDDDHHDHDDHVHVFDHDHDHDHDDHEVHDDHHNDHDAFHRFLKDSPIHLRKVMETHGRSDDDGDHEDHHEEEEMSAVTKEFLEVYERELESFFDRFMKATLQAEIGGVRIESTASGESEENQAIPLSTLRRRLPRASHALRGLRR